ncbi:lipoprotein [Candidatus Accumulibacter sp. ACC003]|uniref:LPS translocon maturation chaperone LptM n=1 Tax=Candidatus Accumulibacter sp. ACC003 TaxID=2823334 RepID=UPI00344BB042
MRHYLALALLATITLGACGTTGSLTLPPKQTLPATPATPATDTQAKPADDSSTPGSATR